MEHPVQRRRTSTCDSAGPSEAIKSVRRTFTRKICRKEFACFHGVSTKRVQRIAYFVSVNKATTIPKDKTVNYSNKANKIAENFVNQVHMDIKSFPRRVSHYSRNDSKRYYLSPEMRASKMYHLWLEHMSLRCTKHSKRARKKTNFKYSFGSPRSDTGVKCDELESGINEDGKQAEEISRLETEKRIHLAKAQVLSGDAFYCRQLWLYNFCIHSAKNCTSHFYLFDETTESKKPNETASFLQHYIDNVLGENFMFSLVETGRFRKIVQFMFSLVETGRFRKIVHHFPEPGHSFLPSDRSFGVIEMRLIFIERIYLPGEYNGHIKSGSNKFYSPLTRDNSVT
ncbi:hypothetical protein PR048_024130, partial [Dryococelus australis]